MLVTLKEQNAKAQECVRPSPCLAKFTKWKHVKAEKNNIQNITPTNLAIPRGLLGRSTCSPQLLPLLCAQITLHSQGCPLCATVRCYCKKQCWWSAVRRVWKSMEDRAGFLGFLSKAPDYVQDEKEKRKNPPRGSQAPNTCPLAIAKGFCRITRQIGWTLHTKVLRLKTISEQNVCRMWYEIYRGILPPSPILKHVCCPKSYMGFTLGEKGRQWILSETLFKIGSIGWPEFPGNHLYSRTIGHWSSSISFHPLILNDGDNFFYGQPEKSHHREVMFRTNSL